MSEGMFMWTSDLAYAIGLITTDGSLSKDGRHVVFVSKDIEQVNNFARILKLPSNIAYKKGTYKPDAVYYVIQFSSVKFYKFLIDIGLMPNKTKIIGVVKIPDEFFPDFLRGHFDGDGYTYAFVDKRWKNSAMMYLAFTSASRDHLIWLSESIERLFNISG